MMHSFRIVLLSTILLFCSHTILSVGLDDFLSEKELQLLKSAPDKKWSYVPDNIAQILLSLRSGLDKKREAFWEDLRAGRHVIAHDVICEVVPPMINVLKSRQFNLQPEDYQEAMNLLLEYHSALRAGDTLIYYCDQVEERSHDCKTFCNLVVQCLLQAGNLIAKGNVTVGGNLTVHGNFVVQDAFGSGPGGLIEAGLAAFGDIKDETECGQSILPDNGTVPINMNRHFVLHNILHTNTGDTCGTTVGATVTLVNPGTYLIESTVVTTIDYQGPPLDAAGFGYALYQSVNGGITYTRIDGTNMGSGFSLTGDDFFTVEVNGGIILVTTVPNTMIQIRSDNPFSDTPPGSRISTPSESGGGSNVQMGILRIA
jgi:hypothetical protein